jgi:cell division protein ZapE
VPLRLVDRRPEVPPERIVAGLVPPPRFAVARFETYRPDPAEPSQAAAVEQLQAFATTLEPPRRGLFGRPKPRPGKPGFYLDGGYGVGKTHLLASLWHAAPRPAAYATFVELTDLVGALGFQPAVQALSDHRLLAIDEFELDDVGSTVLVSTLLTRLVEAGVRVAATSNTLPTDLGQGRFNADDFLREIQGLAAHFEPLRVEGEDYRHRGLPEAPPPLPDDALTDAAGRIPGASLDDFPALVAHLSELHPVRYGALLDDVTAVCLSGVTPVAHQADALRVVVLADRLYDRDVPVLISGVPLDELFPPDMLKGGYQKKYRRAVSRLTALSRDALARTGA